MKEIQKRVHTYNIVHVKASHIVAHFITIIITLFAAITKKQTENNSIGRFYGG